MQLEVIKAELERKDIVYPDYYLKPFHAYDDGNLSWCVWGDTGEERIGRPAEECERGSLKPAGPSGQPSEFGVAGNRSLGWRYIKDLLFYGGAAL